MRYTHIIDATLLLHFFSPCSSPLNIFLSFFFYKKQTNVLQVGGHKNITVISNLESFGIQLDDTLRKEMSKRFSVACSFSAPKGGGSGLEVHVQGKYVMQLEKFVKERFGIPSKYVKIEKSKGASKRDRSINV